VVHIFAFNVFEFRLFVHLQPSPMVRHKSNIRSSVASLRYPFSGFFGQRLPQDLKTVSDSASSLRAHVPQFP